MSSSPSSVQKILIGTTTHAGTQHSKRNRTILPSSRSTLNDTYRRYYNCFVRNSTLSPKRKKYDIGIFSLTLNQLQTKTTCSISGFYGTNVFCFNLLKRVKAQNSVPGVNKVITLNLTAVDRWHASNANDTKTCRTSRKTKPACVLCGVSNQSRPSGQVRRHYIDPPALTQQNVPFLTSQRDLPFHPHTCVLHMPRVPTKPQTSNFSRPVSLIVTEFQPIYRKV